ncbi:MAG: tetratricopeptide repeat protein [Planctomycetota bacterium]|nr:tetratricopeptide repeat protein [Planctomycetota bacterium]
MPSLEQLRKLYAADPNDPFVLYALAQEHARLGQVEESLAHYDRCLSADPAYCYAYYHKAKVLAGAGREPEAIAVLRTGLTAARQARDTQAQGEISAFLDELTP